MPKNIGSLDQKIRLGLGAVLILLYVFKVTTGTLGLVLLAVGVINILTAGIRFCPLYVPFKISTNCDSKKSDREG